MNRSAEEIQSYPSFAHQIALYPELDGYSHQVLKCKNWVKRAE
jgi:hypothetical protein